MKTAQELTNRIAYLENNKGSQDAIEFYKQFINQPENVRLNMVDEYKKYLAKAWDSFPARMFKKQKNFALKKNFSKVKEIAEYAKGMLAQGKFDNPPFKYNPATIRNNFWVQQWLYTKDKLKKTVGSKTFSKFDNFLD